jgi:hypothetical protein
LCGELAAHRILLDVVDERPLTVDLDHREPLPVAGLERLVPGDVDLLEAEPELVPKRPDLCERALAQVASLGVEDGDPGYG